MNRSPHLLWYTCSSTFSSLRLLASVDNLIEQLQMNVVYDRIKRNFDSKGANGHGTGLLAPFRLEKGR